MKLIVTVWVEDSLERYDFSGYDYHVDDGEWVRLTERNGTGRAIFRADAVHSILEQDVKEEAATGNVVSLVVPSKSSE